MRSLALLPFAALFSSPGRTVQPIVRPRRRSVAAAVVALSLASVPLAGSLPNVAAATLAPEVVRIPVRDAASDADIRMVTGVFFPSGDGPFPVVIYSHGRSGTQAERDNTRVPDPHGHIRYWLKKGFAVVAPIRQGYGETGGTDREGSGVHYDIFGNCWGRPAFARAAAAATEGVIAALAWVRQQAWAQPGRVILVGTSMGGLASIASAATSPEGVAAYISFAGGTGGYGKRAPEHSCGSDDMEALMARFGATTHVPGLWLYAKNDSFWGPEWPRAWHRAFAARASPARFVMTGPVADADGHQLMARGSRLWTAHVDRFLGELGF
jgi:dienelactone hydrolase